MIVQRLNTLLEAGRAPCLPFFARSEHSDRFEPVALAEFCHNGPHGEEPCAFRAPVVAEGGPAWCLRA